MCWDEKYPILLCTPLVIQEQSVPPRPRGARGATHDIRRRSSCLFLYLLAPVWGAQRIDGERSSWSLSSEIAAENKLVAGIRDKGKTKKWKKKRLLWSIKNSAQGRQRSGTGNPKQGTKTSGWTAVVETNHRFADFSDGNCDNLILEIWSQHHRFSCSVLWAGYINNILPATSLVPNAQPTHL